MLFSFFLFSCADGRSSSGQPAWPELGPTDTGPATLDEGPFDAAVAFYGYPEGWEWVGSSDQHVPGPVRWWVYVTIFASPAPREIAKEFFGDDEDCSVEPRYHPVAEQGSDHVLVNVGAEVISVPQVTTDSAWYRVELPDELPSGTTFGLSGSQTLTLLGPPDLTQHTINALDSWHGGDPIDIAWTPRSDETFVVETDEDSCRVVNDGEWTVPALPEHSKQDLYIRSGAAGAVDSRELGHVLLLTWTSLNFEIHGDTYDDM